MTSERLNENNIVEVVQRNLIMARNTVAKETNIKNAIFNMQMVKNNLTLKTTNGMGVVILMELCEILDIDFEEMFWIDPEWSMKKDGSFKEHWNHLLCDEERYFKTYNHKTGTYSDNMGQAIRENIRGTVESGRIESTNEWRNVLGNSIMTKLNTEAFPNVNFGIKRLGRCVEELGLSIPEIVYFREESGDEN